MNRRHAAAVGLAWLVITTSAAQAQSVSASTPAAPLLVHAAGSLRTALTELAQAHEQARGQPVRLTFGASGLLRDRIVAGETTQVFASANMDHPAALAAAGQAEAVQAFASNALCALATPAFTLRGQTLAQRLLDPELKLGTSTPGADPSGDYAFRMFELIEASGAAAPGSAALLKQRALQLTGGPRSAPPPPGRSVYGELVAQGAADVFITYCTNAAQARLERPTLQTLAVPEAVNVVARYGLVLMKPATPAARAWVDHLLGPEGQAILARHGFGPP